MRTSFLLGKRPGACGAVYAVVFLHVLGRACSIALLLETSLKSNGAQNARKCVQDSVHAPLCEGAQVSMYM